MRAFGWKASQVVIPNQIMQKTAIIAILAFTLFAPSALATSYSPVTSCSIQSATGSVSALQKELETTKLQLESAEKLVTSYSDRNESANDIAPFVLVSAILTLLWVVIALKPLYSFAKFRPKHERLGRYVFILSGILIASAFAYAISAVASILKIF